MFLTPKETLKSTDGSKTDENEALYTKMISEISQNLEQVYGILGSPILKKLCVRDNEALADNNNFLSNVVKPIEEKTEVGINAGDCTSTDKGGMEQLFARLKTIEAKLRTQQQSLDFISRSTANLASSSDTNFAQTSSVLTQLLCENNSKNETVQFDSAREKQLDQIQSNLVVTRQFLEDVRALILEKGEAQEALLRAINALYDEKISTTTGAYEKIGIIDTMKRLEQKLQQLLNGHTHDVAESTKEIGNRIHSGIDSIEKVIRSETNVEEAIDKFQTSYLEQRKYIGRRFSELEDIILQNAKQQRLEISHLKNEF